MYKRQRERWLLVAGWTAGASAVSLIGLWGFATGSGFVSAAEGVRRVQALYDSANNLALYLEMCIRDSSMVVWKHARRGPPAKDRVR